ncbi:MAG: hypothetical protein R3B13_28550 [Polyangiaceae bacterium]
MPKPFLAQGSSGDFLLRVNGVLDRQDAFSPTPPWLLQASAPPGGTDSAAIGPLPNGERSHEAVRSAAAALGVPVPPTARAEQLAIDGRPWPVWVTKEPSLPPRFVGRLWLGIWPEQEGSSGVLLLRSRDINAADDPLDIFRRCDVIRSIRVSLGGA